MNGRELTAYDVEYNFHRLTGLGSGFTEPPAYTLELPNVPLKSITATDEWTVVFELEQTSITGLKNIIDDALGYILPPEVIKAEGHANDWTKLVGTGPYELTDWVSGGSRTYTKNPNYWGYDEKYPENRLPYFDEIRSLIIPEEATRITALRTGKIDSMMQASRSEINNIQLAESLVQTNPELDIWPYYLRSDTHAMSVTHPPYDDIRVRRAMQMALNLEEINRTYFKDYALWKPHGKIASGHVGYHTPYEEWSEEVQGYYAYNQEGAMALLEDAGYTRGEDGFYFQATIDAVAGDHADWCELLSSYWAEIGVDVEVLVMEWAQMFSNIQDRSHDMTYSNAALPYEPLFSISLLQKDNIWNASGIDDPVLEDLFAAASAATTIEEQKRLIKEADRYYAEQHWALWVPIPPVFGVTQPWLIGYNGEVTLGVSYDTVILARLWIDWEMKEAMGY